MQPASRRGLAALGSATAANAWGTTYCVADPGCVSGGGTSQPDVQTALTAAASHAGDDRVQVGPGTFQAAGPNGFQYGAPAGNPVQLVGAGSGQTILTAPNVNGSAFVTTLDLEMASGGGSTISDLAVHLPGVTSGTGGSVGILAAGADLVRIAVTTPSTVNIATGVEFQTGTLQDSTVSVPQGLGGAAAVRVNDGQSGTIADSTLSGYYGIYGDDSVVADTTITAQRDRIQSLSGGQGIYTPGSIMTAEDTLIQASGTGVRALTRSGHDGTSTLRNVTITGDPPFGIYAQGANSGKTATINLDSSIIDTGFTSIFSDASGGGASIVNANYSNYPASSTGAIGGGVINETSDMHVDPKFVNSTGQDFHLRFDSPLLDVGNPTNSGGSKDLDGLPRVVNGRLDMGPFEYQRRPPSAVATAAPGTVQSGQAVTFDGTGSSDPDPGDTIAYTWAFDDGATATGPVASHVFTTPGSHMGTLTVTDPAGLQASASATVSVIPSVTGQRAAALASCKKRAHKHHWSHKRLRKCKKKANLLPV